MAGKNLPKPEVDLPKPQTDLPLPEKEIPEHAAAPKTGFHIPKLAFIAGILFVLVVALGGGYLLFQNNANQTSYSPTPTQEADETANWKTYASPNGYSLKYPPELVIAKDPGFELWIKSDKYEIKIFSPFQIGASFSTVLNSQLANFAGKVQTNDQLEVGGKEAIRISGNINGKDRLIPSVMEAIKLNDSEYLRIDGFASAEGNQEGLEKLFNQVLATFKFTDETANWKTYEAKGFSFQYPSDFEVEERVSNFYAITPKGALAATEGIFIDARLTGTYDQEVTNASKNLTNMTQTNITNGVKIEGVIGPGFGEGMKVTDVILKNGSGAIKVGTSDPNITSEVFDNFVSNLKFTQ